MTDIIERLDARRDQESGITELEVLLLDAADEIGKLRSLLASPAPSGEPPKEICASCGADMAVRCEYCRKAAPSNASEAVPVAWRRRRKGIAGNGGWIMCPEKPERDSEFELQSLYAAPCASKPASVRAPLEGFGHTDLMISPEGIDECLRNNPTPPDLKPIFNMKGHSMDPLLLADAIDQLAVNPKGGKMASIAYRKCAELIRAKLCEPCTYCGEGKFTGLPNNACENCMNTGYLPRAAEYEVEALRDLLRRAASYGGIEPQLDIEIAAAIGASNPVSQTDGASEERGWLIEVRADNGTPTYHQLVHDDDWTFDASKAIRFARREDAQAYIDHIGWTVPEPVEHMWCDPRPASQTSQSGG